MYVVLHIRRMHTLMRLWKETDRQKPDCRALFYTELNYSPSRGPHSPSPWLQSSESCPEASPVVYYLFLRGTETIFSVGYQPCRTRHLGLHYGVQAMSHPVACREGCGWCDGPGHPAFFDTSVKICSYMTTENLYLRGIQKPRWPGHPRPSARHWSHPNACLLPRCKCTVIC